MINMQSMYKIIITPEMIVDSLLNTFKNQKLKIIKQGDQCVILGKSRKQVVKICSEINSVSHVNLKQQIFFTSKAKKFHEFEISHGKCNKKNQEVNVKKTAVIKSGLEIIKISKSKIARKNNFFISSI